GKSSKSTQRSSRRLEKPDPKTDPVLNKPHTSALAQTDVTEDITETLHHAVFPAVDQSTIIHPHEVSTRKNVLGPPASTPRRAYGRHKSKKVEEVVEPSALLIDIIADDSLPSINQSPDSYSEQFPSNIDIIGNTTAASSNGKVNDSNLSKKKSKPQKSKKAKSKDSNKTKEKQKPKRKPAQSTHD
uniref:Uncharacterized protein n=1 Tax=Ciona savignyi TaxID=51511 RepID=H2YF00_CIOSA